MSIPRSQSRDEHKGSFYEQRVRTGADENIIFEIAIISVFKFFYINRAAIKSAATPSSNPAVRTNEAPACKSLILSNGIVNPLLVFVYECGVDDALHSYNCKNPDWVSFCT